MENNEDKVKKIIDKYNNKYDTNAIFKLPDPDNTISKPYKQSKKSILKKYRINFIKHYNQIRKSKIITPISNIGIHFGFNLQTNKNNFFIDSTDSESNHNNETYINVLPKLPNGDKLISFQSSQEDCWLIGLKVAKILSFVPNDILDTCILGDKKNKDSFSNIAKNPILDFNKLHKKMPQILPHILSFCQSQKYANEFCKLHNIDYKKLLETDFIKITKPENKTTNLQTLLNKYNTKMESGKTYNDRAKNHRNHVEQLTF